jgi:hypothetical protein
MENNPVIPIVKPSQSTIQIPQAVQNQLNKNVVKVPTDVVELPSHGFFNSVEGALTEGKVEIKQMTAKEEDILSNQQFIKKGVVLTELLKSLIVAPFGCLDDLLIGDKNALFFTSRVSAYGKDYKTKMKCPNCGEDCDVNVDLTTVKNKEYDFSNCQKGVNRFDFVLPNSGKRLTYRLLTHKEETAIDLELRSLEKFGKGASAEITTRLKYMIVAVDGNEDKNLIKKFVDTELSSKDSLEFRKAMRNAMPDVDSTFDFECPKCDHSAKLQIPLGISFFWPSTE